MRYELAHDSLARQILDRVSGEAKARRQAVLLVDRAYERYQERKVLLTQEDLDEIRPHEKAINFSPEEQRFIQESKNALARAARRRRQIVIGVISTLSVFLLLALWQWQRSEAGTRALQAKAAYEAGRVSEAFRLAKSAHSTLGADKDTRQTIEEVLQDLYQSGLVRDLEHPARVKNIAIDPTEAYILSITESQLAYIWDFQGRLQYQLEHPVAINSGAFIPWEQDRQILTTAGNTAYFWESTGKIKWQFSLQEAITGFDFNDRRQLIVLWNARETVLLDGQGKAWSFRPSHRQLLNASFSPNGNDLLLVTPDSVSSWWLDLIERNRPSPRLVIPGQITWADYIASDHIQLEVLVQFADSSKQVYNSDGVLDTVSYYQYLNRELKRLPHIQRFWFPPPGFDQPKTLFQTDSTNLRYWSAYRKNEAGERAGVIDFYTRYEEPVLNATFSQDNQYLLTASADGRVDIWNTGLTITERYKRFRAQIREAGFARENRYLISSPLDHRIQLWLVAPPLGKTSEEILEFFDQRLQK